jgi:acyl transferase domain-containing protein/acyl carrier protein
VRGTAAVESSDIDRVEAWLLRRVAEHARIAPAEVDPAEPFERYGFDSAASAELAADLAQRVGRPLPETLLYEHPTPAAVLAHLSGSARPAASPRRAGQPHDPVAVVGMACRFPGADDPGELWELVRGGVDAIGEVPAGRWDGALDPDLLHEYPAARWGGWLDDVQGFDARAFGIAPREAAWIDPQQRLLMEVAVEAIESAGIPLDGLAGTDAGVFVGISTRDYAHVQMRAGPVPDGHAATGSAGSIAANRLSYTLDLQGPSVALDTACSSSAVAVHLACQAIRGGDCEMALAGGVNLMLIPETSLSMARLGALAPDGRCKTFDARADGYVRGEGAGIVVLKPLSAALAEGDAVQAVIRGSAVNNDGRTNGLTAPSGQAQVRVLRRAYASAGVEPASVGYVEAHGTGTRLGDPIEAGALSEVLGAGRPLDQPCPIGSIKTNVGHLEAAAGVAALIKVVQAMRHAELPPSINFETPNPLIPFERLAVAVQREAARWPHDGDGMRRAGISSFGFGGTNAHLVVENVT